MRLLVDTDAFCKLGIAGLLEEAVRLVKADLSECGRLPALPHMLRKGGLPKKYGVETCQALLADAERMVPIAPVNADKLEPFVSITDIDPGEAQLLATIAGSESLLISGDKRALRAVRQLTEIVSALKGRVMTIEAILLALADRIDLTELRRRANLVAPFDQTMKICFSPGNADPISGLRSYFESLETEVHPLVLWNSHRGAS